MSVTDEAIEAVRRLLIDDVTDCWMALKTSDEQVNRRNYVRAVFALVDGFLSALKAYVIEEWKAGRFNPAPSEMPLLLEENYDVDDTGKVRTRAAFIPIKNNVRFTFDIFARAHGVVERPDYSEPGWQAFQTAARVRNRVTHPKVTADLDIADER